MIKQGTIIKGIGGFYYVDTGEEIVECKARGLFRKENMKPCVGDEVDISIGLSSDDVVISRIKERKNHFLRPPVSNVDQFVVVTALVDPEPNQRILDRFIVCAEAKNVDVVLCFTKKDAAGFKAVKQMADTYKGVYPYVFVDGRDPSSVSDLIPYLKDRKSALAGPSGAGKSTILRTLRGNDEKILTGSVSEKTGRGKHTTRHVEVFSLEFGGMVFDTPGFTSFDIFSEIGEDELQEYYPEIAAYRSGCRFKGCYHLSEPGCAVRKAVSEKKIHPARYGSYVTEMELLKQKRKY